MKLRVQFAGCMIALGISAGLALPCAAQRPSNNDRPPRQQAQPRQEQHQQHRQDRPVRAPSPQRERAYTPPPRNPAGNNSPAGPARAFGGGESPPQPTFSFPRLSPGKRPKPPTESRGVDRPTAHHKAPTQTH